MNEERLMRDGKLLVGVVGLGGIARDQHLPGWLKVPFVEVVALADLSAEALSRAAQVVAVPEHRRYADWQELVALDELDIIDICTPNRTHMTITLAALSAGKHVLCEKPLATTSDEVRRIAEAARTAQRLVMTGQHLRFDSISRQLKGLIDDGLVGEVYYARAQWLRRRLLPSAPTFIERRLSGGGPGFDIGVHVLDLTYWLMGAPEPVSVSAVTSDRLAHRDDIGGHWGEWDRSRFDVEDFAMAFVRFANGASLTLEVSWLLFQPEREIMRTQLYGTHGGLIWPDGVLAGESHKAPWDLKLTDVTRNHAHHEEIAQFAVAVRDGGPSPVPVEQTLNVTRILEALYVSAESRREVMLAHPPAADHLLENEKGS
jgi:predicted dehydrogenase